MPPGAKKTTATRFELAHPEDIALAGQRLNHSATLSRVFRAGTPYLWVLVLWYAVL